MTVDFYGQCKTALSGVLTTNLTAYLTETWQITDNEFDLHRGANHFILFRPGAIPAPADSEQDGEILEMHWQVIVNVFVRFQEKSLQWSQFEAFRGAVWYVLANPRNTITLNNNIWRVLSVISGEEASYWRFLNTPADSQPNFMTQPLTTTVKQRVVF